jgi:hypothetical protein
MKKYKHKFNFISASPCGKDLMEIFVIDRLSLFAAYIAWRRIGISRTLKDIALASDIRRKDLKDSIFIPRLTLKFQS